MSLEQRFWEKVDTSGDCWEWTGARTRHGYGQIRGANGRTRTASRVAWTLTHGPIPKGMSVLHKCDNPPCVRPDHLWLGTKRDNSRDMARKGRWRNQFGDASTDTCVHGHDDYVWISGKRVCATCRRRANADYKRRQIEARPPRSCPICGAEFPAFGKRKYCTKRCKWTASNRARAGRS